MAIFKKNLLYISMLSFNEWLKTREQKSEASIAVGTGNIEKAEKEVEKGGAGGIWGSHKGIGKCMGMKKKAKS